MNEKRFTFLAPLSMLAALAALALYFGCANKITGPPVKTTETGVYHPGKFVWFALLTDDAQAAQKFYGGLLGWEFEPVGADNLYTNIKANGELIGNIVSIKRSQREVPVSQWLSLLSVPDVDRAVERFRASKGKVHREPVDFPNWGRVAVVSDPQGALIGLVHWKNGDPADNPNVAAGHWLWIDYVAQNPDSAFAFYNALVGYEPAALETKGNTTYYVLKQDGKPRAGLFKNPWQNVRANWLPYVKVEDPKPLLEKVQELGGAVILAPRDEVRKGSLAIVSDPAGAAIALQKYPF